MPKPWNAQARPRCSICDGAGDFPESEYVIVGWTPVGSRLTGQRRKCLTCDTSGVSPRARAEAAGVVR